jgi:hypothetical protein
MQMALPATVFSGWSFWEELRMRFLRRFTAPVSEAQLAFVLAALMLVTSLLLWGIIWQSSIITYQRDLIREIWSWKYGG